MKCEKHGIEMEWRGSLVSGSMHCDHCAAGKSAPETALEFGNRIHREFERKFNFDPGSEQVQPCSKSAHDPIAEAIAQGKQAVQPIPQPLYASHLKYPHPTDDPSFARARTKACEAMLDDLRRGHPQSYCPYCDQTVGQEHLAPMPGTQAGLCSDEYLRDHQIAVSKGHP
jgi:hypothetical protein